MKKTLFLVMSSLILTIFVGILNMHSTSAAPADPAEKKAILVCSFGTTYPETRKADIESLENRVRDTYPGWEVRRAFTAHKIIKTLKERDGIQVDTPEQAMQKLADEGYTSVAMLSLDVIPGHEYNYVQRVFHMWQHKHVFQKLSLSLPLFYYMGQEEHPDDFIPVLTAARSAVAAKVKPGEALLFMAHGTSHPANAFYTVMQDRIDRAGWKNTWVYTVEGTPTLQDVIEKLKAHKVKKVYLMPLMLVAGDHANNDMAGSEPDSHRSQLIAAGFQVDSYLHGMGGNKEVQELYLKRLQEAIVQLDAPASKHKGM